MYPAARLQFERAAREFAQWRSIPEAERSPAAGAAVLLATLADWPENFRRAKKQRGVMDALRAKASAAIVSWSDLLASPCVLRAALASHPAWIVLVPVVTRRHRAINAIGMA
jgi:hypothetical protein